MEKHIMSQSKATQNLAAEQTHGDMHSGRGVIAMPMHDDIAKRAYEIYVSNGHNEGQREQNWLQAEHELKRAAHRT